MVTDHLRCVVVRSDDVDSISLLLHNSPSNCSVGNSRLDVIPNIHVSHWIMETPIEEKYRTEQQWWRLIRRLLS